MARRRLSTWTAALAALLALGLASASTASAVVPEFHSEITNTVLTAGESGTQEVSLGESTLRCESLSVSGSMVGKATTEIDVVPAYSECVVETGGSSLPAHVHTNSCGYALSISEETVEGHAGQGQLAVECESAEDKIEVDVTFLGERHCANIPAQTAGTPAVDFTNVGEGTTRQIVVSPTVEGLSYQLTGICGSAEASNGAIGGEASILGENGSGHHRGIWIGPGEPPAFEASVAGTVLTGHQTGTNVLAVGEGEAELTVECETAEMVGLAEATSSAEVRLAPVYEGCTAGGLAAQLEFGECVYALTVSGETGPAEFEGSLHIDCPEGEEVSLGVTYLGKEYACLRIPGQTPEGAADYALEGAESSRRYQVAWTASAIEYTAETICGEGKGSDGRYSGGTEVTGEDEEGAPLPIWIGPSEAPPPEFHAESGGTALAVSESSLQTISYAGGTVSCAGL